jgi:hypothetical protein
MKKSIITFICFLIAFTLNAQVKLLVIKVEGTIIAQNINKELRQGLEIMSSEKFIFKTPTATASFIDPKTGKISQLNSKKNIYIPDIEVFEDRGEFSESLFTFFSDTVVFFEEISLSLPNYLFDKFAKQEYILSIKSEQDSMVFGQRGNVFILKKDSLFNLRPGLYESQLCSLSKADKSVAVLSDFWLIIPDKQKLLGECSLLTKSTPCKEQIAKNLFEFIQFNYGRIAESDFTLILKRMNIQ